MNTDTFSYPYTIKEIYLDVFAHMNNAMYLTLFEEARWEFLNQRGYGLKKILATGIGPVILEVKMNFLKELLVRDEIVIETRMLSYEGKIGKIEQKMVRDGEVCCQAEFVFAVFNLKERKIIMPTEEWMQVMGIEQ